MKIILFFTLLAVFLTAINLSLWAMATGSFAVWEFPSTENKNIFMLWMSVCIFFPIILGFFINENEKGLKQNDT